MKIRIMYRIFSYIIYIFTIIFPLEFFGQGHPFLEQSYGFLGEGTGSFNKIIKHDDDNFLVVGKYNDGPVIALLAKNGHLSKVFEIAKYKNLILTDVIKGENGYIVSGICKDCIRDNFSSGLVLKINSNLSEIQNQVFIHSENENQVFNTIKLTKDASNIFAVFEGEIPGWGTRAQISKLTEENLSVLWTKHYNESFFSLPNFISASDSTIIFGTQGIGNNFLIKVDSEGNLISKLLLPQGKSVFVKVSDEAYGYAYLKDNFLNVGILDGDNKFSDSLSINQGISGNSNFSLVKTNTNKLLLVSHIFKLDELPYISAKSRIYTFDIAPFKLVKYEDIPSNGTISRNINQILPMSDQDDTFIIIGDRISEQRPFYMLHSAEVIHIPEPPGWYASSVCEDSELIEKKKQWWWPMTLPNITNDIVYSIKENYKGAQEVLWFDHYRPYDHYAKKSKEIRPCLVYFSGGGYIYTSEDSGETLIHAAESGMIGISVKYRVGVHPNFNGSLDSLINYLPFFVKTVYRALQDARDVMKYIYDHADELYIDRENIFIMGHSAGGNLVYNYNHINQSDFSSDDVSELGPLTAKTNIKGIIPYAAPLIPVTLKQPNVVNYIDVEENEPAFIIHGTCDSTAYYNTGSVFPEELSTLGAYQIVCRKQKLNHAYRFLSIKGGGHDFNGFEQEVYPEIFNWIKNEIICGQSKQSCIILDNQINIPCYDIDTCPDCFISSTSTFQIESEFKVYPSIVIDHITIESDDHQGIVEIFDLMGNVLMKKNITEEKNKIDISNLNSGMFIVRKNNCKKIKKIIKI